MTDRSNDDPTAADLTANDHTHPGADPHPSHVDPGREHAAEQHAAEEHGAEEHEVLVDRRGQPINAISERKVSRHNKKKGRRRAVVVLMALLLLLLPFAAAAGWFWFQLNPSGDPGAEVAFTVDDGWSISRIATELETAKVIGNAQVFELWARIDGAGSVQAGQYTLQQNMGPKPALRALEAGPRQLDYVELALPPGLTVSEIAQRVGVLPGRDGAKFLQLMQSNTVRSEFQPAEVTTLEGLTWPETYYVYENEDELAILRRLVKTFDDKMKELDIPNRALGVGYTPYEAVVVASLIQTESIIDSEFPLVSAVVRNRLNQKMLLQIDATLLYARGDKTNNLTNADKLVDSPYNTYKYPGLPPTPIATVTGPTLLAATAPADVPYLFYVLTDGDGNHKFATTLAEHEANVADSRRRGVF